MSSHEPLHQFMTAHFTLSEMRQLVRYLPDGGDLLARLPDGSVSPIDFAFETVQLLDRHAALDSTFWSKLTEERPRLAPEISSLRTSFRPLARASSSNLSLILARASKKASYTEIEFLVRNESTLPQFITELRLTAQNITIDYTPRVSFEIFYHYDFIIAMHNRGWSTVVVTLSIDIVPTYPGAPAFFVSETVHSGKHETLFELSAPHEWQIMNITGSCTDLESGIQVAINQSLFRRDLRRPGMTDPCFESNTTYVCLFGTGHQSCQKTYEILRAVPPGKADIFTCMVSTDRSSSFDLVVDLVSPDDTVLSTRHDGLAVVRAPQDQRDIEDGAVFTLDTDRTWNLRPVARKPWAP